MRLFYLLVAACFSMLVHTTAFAKISADSTQPQARYSTERPLHYRIATLDPRLNIDQQQMIELSKQAAAIWEKDTGQNYFVYDPEADFVINLVFDQRQIRSMKRSENLNQLEQEQLIWLNQSHQLQKLKEDLAQSNVELESQKNLYQTQTQQYEQALAKFKADGANKSLFASIQKQQHLLRKQATKLQGQVAAYNKKVQQLNDLTEKSNQVHQQLVESTTEFNQTFKPQILHKGQFDGQQIFIYEFSSIDDLRITLAHEFGHALGLKHTHDPKSLMYPRIREQDAKDFKLTDTDLALLGFSH